MAALREVVAEYLGLHIFDITFAQASLRDFQNPSPSVLRRKAM
jgi:hypothetical protein